MNINDIKNIKTQEEARQYAIDWQNWQSDKTMSYKQAVEWVNFFY